MKKEKYTIPLRKYWARLLFVHNKYYLQKYLGGSSKILILMYHRILPPGKEQSLAQPGMFVSVETFKMQIQFLKRHFNLLNPIEFMQLMKFKAIHQHSKPYCLITFDDGWIDFYKYAFPILIEYRVPSIVFLPTNFIGTEKHFWTDDLAGLMENRRMLNKKHFQPESLDLEIVEKLESLKGSYEDRIEKAITILKKLRFEQIQDIINIFKSRWANTPISLNRAFIDWDEIREMRQSGFVYFGSHTANHKILTTLEEKEVHEELMIARSKLLSENIVEKGMIPFCYPNGNYSPSIARLVSSSGYTFAVTTQPGWNSNNKDLFVLKRTGIHEDVSSTAELFCAKILQNC